MQIWLEAGGGQEELDMVLYGLCCTETNNSGRFPSAACHRFQPGKRPVQALQYVVAR